MADIKILAFDYEEYRRDELAKLSDRELYDLYMDDEKGYVECYDIDELTCNMNDDMVDTTHRWFFPCDFDKAQEKADEQQAMFDEKKEQGKEINLDYDAGDIVTWHCDDDGQDHTSTITGISIEVNSEGEAEVTYKTEIEFNGHKQDAYFSEYDIVNK